MSKTNLPPRGLVLAFPTLLLGACASSPAVKPEPFEIQVPTYVRLPNELTAQVPEPILPANHVTNEGLADWADQLKAALREANRKLRAIEGLQPGQP